MNNPINRAPCTSFKGGRVLPSRRGNVRTGFKKWPHFGQLRLTKIASYDNYVLNRLPKQKQRVVLCCCYGVRERSAKLREGPREVREGSRPKISYQKP